VIAADWCHASVVELLCAAPGASAALMLKDGDGRTPLAAALSPVTLSHFASNISAEQAAYRDVVRAHQSACVAVLRSLGAS
jgi:hypothetical protein